MARSSQDISHMRAALALATRGLGRVAPNPSVGCVLVQDGRIVGRGWTQPGGRPHAETEALARAGVEARGATAYVTLEPCSHQGVTGPCAVALINAGVSRVVCAMEDPDERVSGRGLVMLRDAGIEVESGVLEPEAKALNQGFILHRTQGRPMVTLKLATTLDGKIATAAGDSKWITGAEARAEAHGLRANHDAILVGSGTALADQPALTCRLPGVTGQDPLRVLLDRRGRVAEGAAPRDAAAETMVLGGDDCEPGSALTALADRGVTRLLIEGGGAVAASFLRAGLVDRVVWFQAGGILGGDAAPAVASLGLSTVSEMPRFTLRETRLFGNGDRMALLFRSSD